MKALWCAIFSTALAGAAWAQQSGSDDDEGNSDRDRIRKLEEEVERLKKDRAPGLRLEGTGEILQEKKADEFDLKASFLKDGLFHFKAGDDFDLHVGGRVLEEYRYIADRPNGPGPAILGAAPGARAPADSFYLREIFISLDTTVWHDWGAKVNGDLATDQTARLEEGYFYWQHFRELRFQFGEFKPPQSYEYMGSPRFLEEIQRTAMSRLNPGIELGIMAMGDVWDNRFHYWVALTNGRGHLNGNGRSVLDDNDNKEVDAKIAITPWLSDKDSPLKKFRIGGYYNRDLQGMGQPGSAAPAGGINLGNVNTNEFNETWVTMPGGAITIGEQTRYGAELLYAYGPFGMRAEYQVRKDRFQNAAGTIDERLPWKAYYVTVMWMVTGEEKVITSRPTPIHDFDFAGGWGALELLVRWSCTSYDWDKFKTIGGSAAAGANTNRLSALTAGVNWWTTKNTRISVDYVAELFNDPLQYEADKDRKSMAGILARFQIDF
jgi:phosphate-selective porin OprO/OprP